MVLLNVLAELIGQTLSPDRSQRRDAEKKLSNEEKTSGFAVDLLQLIAQDHLPQHIRQATAVYMKNFINRFYEDSSPHTQVDRNKIKLAIIDVMLASPQNVRNQLSAVVAVIAEHEYPAQWPNLVPDLCSKLTAIVQPAINVPQGQSRVNVINWINFQGIIETLDAIFARYQERMRSNDLYREINYSLNHAAPLVKDLFVLINKIFEEGIDKQDEKVIETVFHNANLVCKVFYSLCWQDYPEYVEDNMEEFMTSLKKLLGYHSDKIDYMGEDEATNLDKMQTTILEIADIYTSKYDEPFHPYLKNFLNDTWTLLVKRSNTPKYDGVVTMGIKFLTSVAKSPYFRLLEDPNLLQEICKRVIIPNMELREEDIELFEDNPVEYVRSDMEGSDSGTRRRGAVELVKGLRSHFENAITDIFQGYVSQMLAPEADWRSKDTAIYIVTALGWRTGTAAGGATETSTRINVVDFFNNFVMPSLDESSKNPQNLQTPIFTADLIKFIISFRNQIPKQGCGNVILACGRLLGAREPVVKTYSAACIERILTVRDPVPQVNGNSQAAGNKKQKGAPRMTKADMQPLLSSFLPIVIQTLQESSQQNEYLMRLVLRFSSVTRDGMLPYIESLVPTLVSVLTRIMENPGNPLFNHYLCETFVALIHFNASPSNIALFEGNLIDPLCKVLVDDITELAPYVFQILSQLMAVHENALPERYGSLMEPILNPSMWERRGYVPGMVQFISTFMERNKQWVLSANQLQPILGVFQNLLAVKATDHHGLALLTTIFITYDAEALSPYVVTIMKVLLTRLQQAKTTKLVLNLIHCLSVFVVRFGASALKGALDNVQQNVFESLLKQVWLPDVASIRNSHRRHVCAIALTELACGSDMCSAPPYFDLWAEMINCNVAITEGFIQDQEEEEIGDSEEAEAAHLGGGESYSAAHSQLKWGTCTVTDAVSLVVGKNPRTYLVSKLNEFTARHGDRFQTVIQHRVDEKVRLAISAYAAPTQVS